MSILPREGSEPEGAGFGKPWVPAPGVTFLVFGAYTRSIIDPDKNEGLVAVDLEGKWNHGAIDTLSCIISKEVAWELAAFLAQAVQAATKDEERWRKL